MKELDALPTIHYAQVAEPRPNSLYYQEALTFHHALPQLLAEGHEGEWALIKGEKIVCVFETFEQCMHVGRVLYALSPFLIQPVREWRPYSKQPFKKLHFSPEQRELLSKSKQQDPSPNPILVEPILECLLNPNHSVFSSTNEWERLPTIHYTQLAEPTPGCFAFRELQVFHRELPRLLAEGHEGKWALIKDGEIIDLYATYQEAHYDGRERFLMQPFILQPVREWQPVLRQKVHY